MNQFTSARNELQIVINSLMTHLPSGNVFDTYPMSHTRIESPLAQLQTLPSANINSLNIGRHNLISALNDVLASEWDGQSLIHRLSEINRDVLNVQVGYFEVVANE